MKCFTITASQKICDHIMVGSLLLRVNERIPVIMAGKEKAEILPVALPHELANIWRVNHKVYISAIETDGQRSSAQSKPLITTTKEALILLEAHRMFHITHHRNCEIILSGIMEKNGKKLNEGLIKIKKDQRFLLQPEVGESEIYYFNGRDVVKL
jgi:hypothetical protein